MIGRLTPGDNIYSGGEGDISLTDSEKQQNVENQVDKIIAYENIITDVQNGTYTGDLNNDWPRKVIGIASNEGDGYGIDGLPDNNYMRGELEKYSNSKYCYFTELYQSVGNSGHIGNPVVISKSKNEYDKEGNPNSSDLVDELNQGCSLLLYAGHASEVNLTTTNFNISSVNQLNNYNKYFLGCVVGCSIGSHDEKYMSLAEYLQVAKASGQPVGSIAMFVSTVLQSWEPPMHMQRQLNDTIINSTSVMTIGELFKEAVLNSNFANINDFWFYQILGDPLTRYILTVPELSAYIPEPEAEPEAEPEPEPNYQCLNQSEINYVSTTDATYNANKKFIFNNVDFSIETYIGVNIGKYTLNIPSEHPFGLVIDDDSLIEINLEESNVINQGTTLIKGVNVTHYTGLLVFNVKEDFGIISYNCLYHGYMGGENKLRFTYICSIAEPEPEPEMEPEMEPEQEPEPILLPDFSVGSNSFYNSETNQISLEISNIGNVTSTGYNNIDYKRIFEVTTDINESNTIQQLAAGTPIYVNNSNNVYYPKSQGTWGLNLPIENINIDSNKYTINDYYVSQTSGSFYIETAPLHEPGDTYTITFDIKVDQNNFVPGRTYIFSADDIPFYSDKQGDTEEIIDDLANPSNNYFVWTIPTGLEEPEPEQDVENTIFSLNYSDSRLADIVTQSTNILSDILTSSQESKININVYVDENMQEGILGQASWSTKEIWLNVNNLTNTSTFRLNDVSINLNVPVLVHEILHVFGLVGIGSGSQFANDGNSNPPNVYTGANGVIQYKNVLASNGKSTENINYVPMEDDYGSGTAMAHFEEGENADSNGNFTGDETRVINNVTYPVLRNELMSGFLNGGDNYLTPMTLGLLEDRGFGVNYNSQYVVSTGNNFWWIPDTGSLLHINYNGSRSCKNCKVIHK